MSAPLTYPGCVLLCLVTVSPVRYRGLTVLAGDWLPVDEEAGQHPGHHQAIHQPHGHRGQQTRVQHTPAPWAKQRG